MVNALTGGSVPAVPAVPLLPTANAGGQTLEKGSRLCFEATAVSIGNPFKGKYGFRQAVTFVTAEGESYVTFFNLTRDAFGTISLTGIKGGAKYKIDAEAAGKMSTYDGVSSNILNKVKLTPVVE